MRLVWSGPGRTFYAALVALSLGSIVWVVRARATGRQGKRNLLHFVAKAVGWLLYLVVALLLVGVAAWFTAPRLLGWEPEVVLSGSMEPTLPRGSVAFVEPRPPEAVDVGDILTYRHPERPRRLVTHRVVEVVREDGDLAFRTKGDANDAADRWLVPASNVVGTVRYSLPYIGYVTQRVRTPLGFALAVGLPAALIIVGELRNIARQLSRRREKAGP